MTDNQQTQTSEVWTVVAVASMVAGIGSIILAFTVRYMDIGWAVFAGVAAIILALTSASKLRKAGQSPSMFGTVGSITGAIGILIIVAWEIMLQ